MSDDCVELHRHSKCRDSFRSRTDFDWLFLSQDEDVCPFSTWIFVARLRVGAKIVLTTSRRSSSVLSYWLIGTNLFACQRETILLLRLALCSRVTRSQRSSRFQGMYLDG